MIRTTLVSSAILLLGLAPAGLEKVKLEFKHTENTSSTLESTIKTHQVLSIAGMDRETGSDRKVTVTRAVGKRGQDGRLPIHQKIDALVVQLQLAPGVTVNFDSANPNVQNDNPQIQTMLEMLRASAGASHTIVLGKDNKVIGIEGAEKVLEKASPAAAEALRADLDPERMKKAAEESFAVLPPDPVGEGDSWTRTSNLQIGGGQSLTFETRFEYAGTVEKAGKKLDKIATSTTSVKYAASDKAPFKVPRSNLKIDSSKGAVLFDRAKGQVVESTSAMHIVGDMTFEVNGMEIPAELNLTFDTSTNLVK